MIYVRDKGRMCNNILQYAHLYAWGKEHGRETLSMRFAYKYPYFKISNSPRHNFFRYLIGKFGAKWKLMPVVDFDNEDLSQAEVDSRVNTLLNSRNAVAQGWWVRFYPEFLKHKSEIIDLFSFKPAIEQYVANYLKQHGAEYPVKIGMHIRRGDYARWQGGRYLFSDKQYIDIIKQIAHLQSQPMAIYICGNDPQLDKEAFRNALKSEKVAIFFPDGNPGQDLCLLSHCDLLVGPPSTFTLTAALYHDTPLYWMKDPNHKIAPEDFKPFDTLFKEII